MISPTRPPPWIQGAPLGVAAILTAIAIGGVAAPVPEGRIAARVPDLALLASV